MSEVDLNVIRDVVRLPEDILMGVVKEFVASKEYHIIDIMCLNHPNEMKPIVDHYKSIIKSLIKIPMKLIEDYRPVSIFCLYNNLNSDSELINTYIENKLDVKRYLDILSETESDNEDIKEEFFNVESFHHIIVDGTPYCLTNVMMSIFFDNLIKKIFDAYQIDHVSCDGIDYYYEDETWWNSKDNIVYTCDGNFEHEVHQIDDDKLIEFKDIRIINRKPKIYHMKLDEAKFLRPRYNIDDPEYGHYTTYEYCLNIIDSMTPNSVVNLDKAMDIDYNGEGDGDHRGSTHLGIMLGSESSSFSNAFNMNDFAIAMYSIKEHKFDTWYELYSRCEFNRDKNIDNSSYTLNVIFGYGS